MGQRRSDGSELSIWDYPDLMEGIERPMGGNLLSVRADFITLTCDVEQEEPCNEAGGAGTSGH